MSTADSNSPLVSVMAVSYNHERFLVETLESIRRQKLTDWELIYADDASSDRSAEVATDWLRSQGIPAHTIIHKENRGLCRTLNEALRRCRGKYVQMIACDDVLRPEKFQRQVEALEQLPESVVMACSNFSRIDEDGTTLTDSYYPEGYQLPEDMFIGVLAKTMLFNAPSVLLRRDVYDVIGGYDESFDAEGFQTWLEIFSRPFSAIYVPEVLIDYRIVKSSMSHGSSRELTFIQQRLRAIDKFECEGARQAALQERRKAEYLKLAEYWIDQRQFDQAETWNSRYVEMLTTDEKRHCPRLLSAAFASRRGYARQLMRRFGISSGNRLKDFLYRWDLRAAMRLAVALDRHVIGGGRK